MQTPILKPKTPQKHVTRQSCSSQQFHVFWDLLRHPCVQSKHLRSIPAENSGGGVQKVSPGFIDRVDEGNRCFPQSLADAGAEKEPLLAHALPLGVSCSVICYIPDDVFERLFG